MTAASVCGVPGFFTDGCSRYLPALIAVYHQVKEFARGQTWTAPPARAGARPGVGLGATGQREERWPLALAE